MSAAAAPAAGRRWCRLFLPEALTAHRPGLRRALAGDGAELADKPRAGGLEVTIERPSLPPAPPGKLAPVYRIAVFTDHSVVWRRRREPVLMTDATTGAALLAAPRLPEEGRP